MTAPTASQLSRCPRWHPERERIGAELRTDTIKATVGTIGASQRETAETLASHSEMLLGIADEMNKLSER